MAAGVGIITLITVPGNVEQKIAVQSIQAERNGKAGAFFMSAPDKSVITIKNTGTGFAKPYAKVSLKYMGSEVYSYDMNNQEPRANVLPGSSRQFKDDIKNISKPGKYTISTTTSIFKDNASSEILLSEATFWYVPSWMLIALGVLLALLTVGILLSLRRIKKGRR